MLLRVDFFFFSFFFAEEVLTGEKSGECCRVVLCSVIGVIKTARVGQKEANPLAPILFWLLFCPVLGLEATL